MRSLETLNKYWSILKLSADTRDQLQSSDVSRVLDAAVNQNCLLGFCKWLLLDVRPQTKIAILNYRNDVVYNAGKPGDRL